MRAHLISVTTTYIKSHATREQLPKFHITWKERVKQALLDIGDCMHPLDIYYIAKEPN